MVEAQTSAGDAELIDRLRAGDEAAFRQLVTCHDRAMRRLAGSYVSSAAVADEVVQETWLAVIRGLTGFEGRSSLKTWIFRVLVNRARTRGAREARMVPFSSLGGDDDDGPTVDPGRFVSGEGTVAGYWARIPSHFFELPDERLLANEASRLVTDAIAALPERQRQVIGLRDVEGWEADEVCEMLSLTPANQRVLLHRARAAVRAVLEGYFSPEVMEA